jgi:hypothetical protein
MYVPLFFLNLYFISLPVVGRDYRLSIFWLAKEVKKEVAASVLIKTIKYYENTNCTLKER